MALSQPVGELRRTSSPSSQTCHPPAHRSATEQPGPEGRSVLFPAAPPQWGVRLSALRTPGTDQAPEQPAIRRQAAGSTNPSRVPSAQPTVAGGPMNPWGGSGEGGG